MRWPGDRTRRLRALGLSPGAAEWEIVGRVLDHLEALCPFLNDAALLLDELDQSGEEWVRVFEARSEGVARAFADLSLYTSLVPVSRTSSGSGLREDHDFWILDDEEKEEENSEIKALRSRNYAATSRIGSIGERWDSARLQVIRWALHAPGVDSLALPAQLARLMGEDFHLLMRRPGRPALWLLPEVPPAAFDAWLEVCHEPVERWLETFDELCQDDSLPLAAHPLVKPLLENGLVRRLWQSPLFGDDPSLMVLALTPALLEDWVKDQGADAVAVEKWAQSVRRRLLFESDGQLQDLLEAAEKLGVGVFGDPEWIEKELRHVLTRQEVREKNQYDFDDFEVWRRRLHVLVRHGAAPALHAKDRAGLTLLHHMAVGGHAGAVEFLLDAGADPFALTDAGLTPSALVGATSTLAAVVQNTDPKATRAIGDFLLKAELARTLPAGQPPASRRL
jgi:hypothetical protein